MPETALADAVRLAERLRANIAAAPISSGAAMMTVTASIGVAEASLTRKTVSDLLGAADAALYDAKRGGRDRVVAAGKS